MNDKQPSQAQENMQPSGARENVQPSGAGNSNLVHPCEAREDMHLWVMEKPVLTGFSVILF